MLSAVHPVGARDLVLVRLSFRSRAILGPERMLSALGRLIGDRCPTLLGADFQEP